MSSTISRIPFKSLIRSLSCRTLLIRSLLCRTLKMEQIADQLLDLNELELHDYRHKSHHFILPQNGMEFHRYGPAPHSDSSAAGGTSSAAAAAKEKTAFDVKLEKFDSSVKLKVIKEIRAFTDLGLDLGLKEAKDLVEKAPAVVKKGVTKEEGDKILEKLKEVGATVVLE